MPLPTPPHRRSTPRARLVPLAIALLACAAPGRAETVRVFPGDGCTEIQVCIDISAAGDAILIATDEPIGRSVELRRSLRLEAAPGARPTFAAESNVFISTAGDAAGDFTVRGLTFERGSIRVSHASTGPLRLAILENVIRDSQTPFAVAGFFTTPAAGDVSFEIRDNDVFASQPSLGAPVGSRVGLEAEPTARETIAGNRVTLGPGFRTARLAATR